MEIQLTDFENAAFTVFVVGHIASLRMLSNNLWVYGVAKSSTYRDVL